MVVAPTFYPRLPKNPSDAQLIEWLKQEVRRVKIQRNEYEQRLTAATKELVKVSAELKALEKYINRKP